MSHRAGVCDDVAPGGSDGFQPEDNCPPHSALHSVCTPPMLTVTRALLPHLLTFSLVVSQEAGGSSRLPRREEASAAQRGSAGGLGWGGVGGAFLVAL